MAKSVDIGSAFQELRDAVPGIEALARERTIKKHGITYDFQYLPALEGLELAESLREGLGAVLDVLPQLAQDPVAAIGALLSRFPRGVFTQVRKRVFKEVYFQREGMVRQKIAGHEDFALNFDGPGRAFLVYELVGRAVLVNLVPPSASGDSDPDL